MSEQQLDLLEVPSRFAAELRAGTSQIVGCKFAELCVAGVTNDQTPDGLFVADRASLH